MTKYIVKILSNIFYTVQEPEPPFTTAEKVGLWLAFFSVSTAIGGLLALALVMIANVVF